MTKREMFNLIATVNADNADIVKFCADEIALMDKTNSKAVARSARQYDEKNAAVKAQILDVMTAVGDACNIGYIKSETGLSSQKIAAILKRLTDEGRVLRVEDKRTVTFSLV